MMIYEWFTRDGSLNCTVGNRLSNSPFLRRLGIGRWLYFRWNNLCRFSNKWYFWYDQKFRSTPAGEDCPRMAEGTLSFQREHETHWAGDGTCSYCGSLSPQQFIDAIKDGAELVPTDKNYKAYLEGPKAPKVHGAAKFYFQHLCTGSYEELRKEFIQLLNDGKIKFGYPGHFYQTPYFLQIIS